MNYRLQRDQTGLIRYAVSKHKDITVELFCNTNDIKSVKEELGKETNRVLKEQVISQDIGNGLNVA